MTKGLYIHVPFCKTICYYCDFCHIGYNEQIVDKWLIALASQLNNTDIEDIDSIYIGGGTPNCLNNEQLETLFKLLEPYSKNVKEYTIEINAESMNDEKYHLLKKYNINRISIGLESTDDKMLKFLNRKSSFADIKNCINSFIDVGINNISIDLMYSLPNQTLKDFMNDIDLVLTLPIKHISIYALTIEENTVFGRKGIKSQDDDIEADMYLQAIDKFEQAGFKQYEISNFAKEGYQSIHNLHYWHFDDFYGIGPGASGKIDYYLYDNTRNVKEYIQNPQSKDIMPFADKDEEMFEHIMMNLRLVEGIDIIKFNERYNIDIIAKYKKVIDDLLFKNLLSIEGNFLKCTKQGLPLLNRILKQFMD